MYDPERITYIGQTDFRNKRIRFGIKAKDRVKHLYTIGKTGMGKSTLLETMAIQDIRNGEGFAFIDPHGKSAKLLLDYVPEERINDVLYFAPFDLDYPVSFNVMEDVGYDKRHLVASGLMSAFKKIWVDTWSARMEYILNNTILALLEYPDSTLISINRMLADKDYRKMVVQNITDPSVKSFWVDEFAKYTDRFAAEATPAIQNKIGQFISNPVIRNIIGQPKSSFDIRQLIDDQKIIIINLSKGQVGEANANLLGSMLITKIYLAAMSRADLSESKLGKLPNFYLYVDEFQSFANESFADILSEARKYKLNLTIAHQYIEQMSEEVRAAVFGNVGTMAVFRVGAYDAEVFEKEFSPQFTAENMVNLGLYQMVLKLMIDGVASSPFSAVGLPPIPAPEISYHDVIIGRSRDTYATPRAKVEEAIRDWHQKSFAETKPDTRSEKSTSTPHSAERKPEVRPQSPAQNNERRDHNDRPRQEAPRPFQPQKQRVPERETELRKAVSLSYLSQQREQDARKKEKAKGPSPERVSELKQALQAILKTEQANAPTTPQPPKERVQPAKAVPPQAQPEPVQKNHVAQKEISEDELKKVLEVRDDSGEL